MKPKVSFPVFWELRNGFWDHCLRGKAPYPSVERSAALFVLLDIKVLDPRLKAVNEAFTALLQFDGNTCTETCCKCSLMRKTNMHCECGQCLHVHLTILVLRKEHRFLVALHVESPCIFSPLHTTQGAAQESQSA